MFRWIVSLWKALFGSKVPKENLSGGGMEAVASVGGSEEPMPEPTDSCEVIDRSGPMTPYKCGHEDAYSYGLSLYGERIGLNEKFFAERPFCGDCGLAKWTGHMIRCALCGFGIMPGDPVALYAGGAKFRKEIATKVDGQWVGCLRWNCCPSGGFFAGHWTTNGYRPAFEHGSIVAEVMATGKPIFATSDGKVTVIDDDEKK